MALKNLSHIRLQHQKRITEVTSVISHQLKTPLAGIKSSLEVLLSGDLGELTKDQREYLQLTLNDTEKMIILVKNLLDASRIDEKHMHLNIEMVQVGTIAQSVINNLSSFARAKNTELTLVVGSDIPAIKIDATKIQEVISNIIYNAIRYNKGKGLVTVTLEKKGKYILFSCRDTGIGIASGEKRKIFSKYYRSPRVVDIATDGSGLGLFISKAIITQSGGKIWFSSKNGEGTTFYFTLPIQ